MRFGGNRRGGFGGGNRRFGERRFDDRRYSDAPKPLKVGEEYDVEIKEVGSKGDGIARVNNFVVFVNGTKLGEKAHIKITDVRDRFAIGERTDAAASKTESTTEEVKETSSDDWDSDDESEEGESEESEDEDE